MTCIQKFLELKGEHTIFYLNDDSALLTGGNYKDYDFIVTFNSIGFRCAYVAIPRKLFGSLNYDSHYYDEIFDVHGGITYCKSPKNFVSDHLKKYLSCDDIWLGFDAGHATDRTDLESVIKYFPDLKKSMEERKSLRLWCDYGKGSIKNTDYMVLECKNLIEQIIEKATE